MNRLSLTSSADLKSGREGTGSPGETRHATMMINDPKKKKKKIPVLLWMQALPVEDGAPGRLVDVVVDGQDGGHVVLLRLPALALHGIVEHLLRGVLPALGVAGLVRRVEAAHGDGRLLPLGGQRPALAHAGALALLQLHVVQRVELAAGVGLLAMERTAVGEEPQGAGRGARCESSAG